MSNKRSIPQYPPTQQGLEYHCASQSIDLSFCIEPEFRLELVEGKFLIGGTIDGSRCLLKEALIGWGLESAIAFAPIDKWYSALQLAYEVAYKSPDEWLTWSEDLPISSDYDSNYFPPTGSLYKGEHRFCRDNLQQSLRSAVSNAGLGYCFGPNYGMQLFQDVFTPDVAMRCVEGLAENTCHDCYMEGAADLVIEVALPERIEVDEQFRRLYYERGKVLHYWVINPVNQQIQFWRWSPSGYQLQPLDSDGCYRGVSGLTFSPQSLWAEEKNLPIFTSIYQKRQWVLQDEEGEDELDWGSIAFNPIVDLTPYPIQAEQFISWCPEAKLEGGPLFGGSEIGTRNSIAMLLMSLGMVETVKLLPGYEWVRALRSVERKLLHATRHRQQWLEYAQTLAQRLVEQHQVGGVGIIGDLIKEQPLNFWSKIHLVLWEVPEEFDKWEFWQTLPERRQVNLIEVEWATQSQWQEICQHMMVLIGQWQEQEQPNKRKHMRFHWLT